MLVNETEIAEIEQRAELAADALGDPELEKKYAKRAAEVDVPKLVEGLRAAYAAGGGGGDLGLMMRNAVKARILAGAAMLNDEDRRIATLADDVQIHSMNVTSVRGEGRVIIDFRLMVGDAPVLG